MHHIDEAYQCGLNVLKPSERDLQHGLELHRHSLVIDAYGFGPQALPRPEGFHKLVKANASALDIQDYLENESMTRWAFDEVQQREAIKAWEASGVNCVFVNAGEESNQITTVMQRLARRGYAAAVAPHVCSRAFSPAEIESAAAGNKHCYYMTANGVPLANREEYVEEELRYIQTFFQLGVRMMHLTYNRANAIGDGCGEARNGGLTDFGKSVVKEMNRVGVIIDVAHSGEQTSIEAARCSQRPVVASHSMCRSLVEHARAKSNETIRAIADTGGFMGIVAIATFLKRSYDLNAMLDHLAYMIDTFGDDHVAIATDVGFTPEPAESFVPGSDTIRPAQGRRKWRSLSPHNSSSPIPGDWTREKELSLRWTNFPLYTVGLVQRGYSDTTIQKVLGGNALRVAKANWEGREQ
jgi:membrane dipeptidase